jgi:hypothetical protein
VRAARNRRSGLRKLAEPFVLPAPAGVRTRTRLHPTPVEEQRLEQIGVLLGGLYRRALASRLDLGRVTTAVQAHWRAAMKRDLTGPSSSRWAGAITRTAIDSYQLGLRALADEIAMLRAATVTIGVRLCAPVGGRVAESGRRPVRGYADVAQRFAKSRRRAHSRTGSRRHWPGWMRRGRGSWWVAAGCGAPAATLIGRG